MARPPVLPAEKSVPYEIVPTREEYGMKLFRLLLWAGVSVGCWQSAWAEQPQPNDGGSSVLSAPVDQVASVARQWWENLRSRAGQWSVLVQQRLATMAPQPQKLASGQPVGKLATGAHQVPLMVSQREAPGELCPNLPEEQQLLPQGASSLGELQGWFQAVDQVDRAVDTLAPAQQVPLAPAESTASRPLVAPPASVMPAQQQEDALVLEQEHGCGCFDSSVESIPVADLVRDRRHSAGQQLAMQMNEESDGLNDPPLAVPAAPEENSATGLAVTAPWLEDCDDFCHMEALGPSQVEITARSAYAGTASQAASRAAEEMARRGSLALGRIVQGFREAWQILRGQGPQTQQRPEKTEEQVPHSARRISEGDIGL